MSPAEFSLRLQKGKNVDTTPALSCGSSAIAIANRCLLSFPVIGIAGGFAPPTPSAVFTVTGTPQKSDLQITSAVRADGTPSLQDALPKSLSKTQQGVDELISELYTILKSIPTEKPPGSEDIYKMDTSIAFGSDGFMWMNGGPSGCGGGTSEVQPTEGDKAQFKRAVEIVHKLVDEAK